MKVERKEVGTCGGGIPMRSLVGKWQERRDEKGKARRTGKDKDGTGQDRNRELIIFAQYTRSTVVYPSTCSL